MVDVMMDIVSNNRSRLSRSLPADIPWADHTFESCLYQRNSSTIEPVAIGVTPTDVFAVPLNMEGGKTSQLDAYVLVRTFTLKFSEIADIDIITESDAAGGKYGCLTLIVRNRVQRDFIVHCYEHSTLARRLSASWCSWMIRKAAYLDPLCTDSRLSDGTNEYYLETVEALKETDDHMELRTILDEMTEDCLLDMQLKDVAFKSREIFAALFRIASGLITKPLTDREKKITGNPKTVKDIREARSNSYFSKVHGVVLQRMLLFRSCIKTLYAFLANSEPVASRFGLFRGPSPCTIDDFASILCTDVYSTLCKLLGCSVTASDDAVSMQIMTSMNKSPSDMAPMKSVDSFAEYGESVITPISSHRRTIDTSSVIDTFGEEVMTPLRKRIEQQQSTSGKSPFTLKLKQTVADIQVMTLYEISRVISICPVDKAESTERVPYGFLGETIVRLEDWEDMLVLWLERIMALLDNFLVSENVLASLEMRGSKGNRDLALRAAGVIEERQGHRATITSPTPHGLDMEGRLSFSHVEVDPINLQNSLLAPPSPSKQRTSIEGFQKLLDDHGGEHAEATPRLPLSDSPLQNTRKAILTGKNEAKWSAGAAKLAQEDKLARKAKAKKDLSFRLMPMETQEILVFYYASLIQTLCLDTSRIREAIYSDVAAYFVPILSILNIVAPIPEGVREEMEARRRSASPRKSPRKARQHTNNTNLSEAKHDAGTSHTGDSSSFQSLYRMACLSFGSAMSGITGTNFLRSRRTQAVDQPFQIIGNFPTAEELHKLSNRIDITLFGEPCFGLSPSAWRCLLLARRSLEDILELVNLKVPVDPVQGRFVGMTVENMPQYDDKEVSDEGDGRSRSGSQSAPHKVEDKREAYTTPVKASAKGGRGGKPRLGAQRRQDSGDGSKETAPVAIDIGKLSLDTGKGDLGLPTQTRSPPRSALKGRNKSAMRNLDV